MAAAQLSSGRRPFVRLSNTIMSVIHPVVEAAAYFVVTEAVHDPTASRVTISGRRDGDTLILAVTTDAPTRDVTRLSDRVRATGGKIRRRELNGNVVLEVELPCES